MAFYNTQAVVLASQNYSEADRILTLLTYERGRVRAIARGARRPRNRFAGLAQPLNLIEVQLNGNSSLENLTQGQMVNAYRNLKNDLDKLAYASYFLDLFDKATEGASDVAEAFILLLTALELIQYHDDLNMVRMLIEMKLLSGIGFRPVLEHCIFCHQMVDETKAMHYNVGEGGICCSSHQASGQSLPCSFDCLVLLRSLLSIEPRQMSRIEASDSSAEQASLILRESLRQALGELPKSADFLSSVIAAGMNQPSSRQDEE